MPARGYARHRIRNRDMLARNPRISEDFRAPRPEDPNPRKRPQRYWLAEAEEKAEATGGAKRVAGQEARPNRRRPGRDGINGANGAHAFGYSGRLGPCELVKESAIWRSTLPAGGERAGRSVSRPRRIPGCAGEGGRTARRQSRAGRRGSTDTAPLRRVRVLRTTAQVEPDRAKKKTLRLPKVPCRAPAGRAVRAVRRSAEGVEEEAV